MVVHKIAVYCKIKNVDRRLESKLHYFYQILNFNYCEFLLLCKGTYFLNDGRFVFIFCNFSDVSFSLEQPFD